MGKLMDSLNDYIFSGMDTQDLTSNDFEIMNDILFENDKDPSTDTQWFPVTGNASMPPKREKRIRLQDDPNCRSRTPIGKEAAIFYAMRDSMTMSTKEFVLLYNTTGLPLLPLGRKEKVLKCLDEGAFTQLGNTDLDTAIFLVPGINSPPRRKDYMPLKKEYGTL